MSKILIIDDQSDMVKLLALTMSRHGYAVVTATSGARGLQMAAAERPDMILLDYMMPGMNGIEVLRKVKQDAELSSIPVLLVTAKGEDADIVQGFDAGAHDYVTKPFTREVLIARVRSAIRQKENHDALVQVNEQLRNEIAERARVENELVQSRKLEAIGHLAAGIAHEINTPAQYVGDNARFLATTFADVDKLLDILDRLLSAVRNGGPTDDLLAEAEAAICAADLAYIRKEVPKAIEQSLDGINRVADIVRAMKEFAHPEAGQKKYIDLNQTIRSTLTISRSEWKYVAEMVLDLAPNLPKVPCLTGDINQAILNLVVNAAQAVAGTVGDGALGKGVITVRTREVGQCAEMRIEDTGVGIPTIHQDKIFDQFFTTKDVGKGTGLGLSIVHAVVVQKHGGTITFETEEGKGTVFIVRLPLTLDEEAEQRGKHPTLEGVS